MSYVIKGADTQDAETQLGAIRVLLKDLLSSANRAEDISERIQQQLAKINEDENLKSGERHYDG